MSTTVLGHGHKFKIHGNPSATLAAARQLGPDDGGSIAHLEIVNNLADSLAAVSGKA